MFRAYEIFSARVIDIWPDIEKASIHLSGAESFDRATNLGHHLWNGIFLNSRYIWRIDVTFQVQDGGNKCKS